MMHAVTGGARTIISVYHAEEQTTLEKHFVLNAAPESVSRKNRAEYFMRNSDSATDAERTGYSGMKRGVLNAGRKLTGTQHAGEGRIKRGNKTMLHAVSVIMNAWHRGYVLSAADRRQSREKRSVEYVHKSRQTARGRAVILWA